MNPVRVLVLRAAGINCDEETAYAWSLAGAEPRTSHVHQLIETPAQLNDINILTIPGGFSYGDDIASGKILATQIANRLKIPLENFVARGGLLLGICNGFQVLVKAGLLPAPDFAGRVTVTHNDSGRYEDRWVYVETACNHSAFLRPGMRIRLPIAHGEGKLVTDSEATLSTLKTRNHVALRYCDANGDAGSFPINPNGSMGGIAGLTDATGRILGLMPHPERAIERTQLPDWTRAPNEAAGGLSIFACAVESVRGGGAMRANGPITMNKPQAERAVK